MASLIRGGYELIVLEAQTDRWVAAPVWRPG
jgi:hypothetical protein